MPLHLIEGKVPLPFINPCTIAVNRNRTSQESRRAITEMSIELCPTHCFQGQGYKQYIRQNIYLVLICMNIFNKVSEMSQNNFAHSKVSSVGS